MAKDFLKEIVDERTRRNPEFPSLVAEAEARRDDKLERRREYWATPRLPVDRCTFKPALRRGFMRQLAAIGFRTLRAHAWLPEVLSPPLVALPNAGGCPQTRVAHASLGCAAGAFERRRQWRR
ncbi:MAG: hypothetical protein M3O46_05590 [Myxococcota bacterium]|nr:hypothetical protein [Myxococcota bacterium]